MQHLNEIMQNHGKKKIQENKCVVRLRRSAYYTRTGVYFTESLIYLKRKCSGYNILEEEARAAGAMEALPINMAEMEEGIYEVVSCNETRDWESGVIDGYELKLIPYEE